nr:hypothetical protein CTI12_AA265260 [Tanacetum cinerariifolium]
MRNNGNQPRRPWQNCRHDGLLGSGSFPRPSGFASGTFAPKSQTNELYYLNRSNKAYQPPCLYKNPKPVIEEFHLLSKGNLTQNGTLNNLGMGDPHLQRISRFPEVHEVVDAHKRPKEQNLFGIVQDSLDPILRDTCVRGLKKLLSDGGNVVVKSITEVFNNGSRALFIVFTDPDVLDCPICLRPLSAPVNAGEKGIDHNV